MLKFERSICVKLVQFLNIPDILVTEDVSNFARSNVVRLLQPAKRFSAFVAPVTWILAD